MRSIRNKIIRKIVKLYDDDEQREQPLHPLPVFEA